MITEAEGALALAATKRAQLATNDFGDNEYAVVAIADWRIICEAIRAAQPKLKEAS